MTSEPTILKKAASPVSKTIMFWEDLHGIFNFLNIFSFLLVWKQSPKISDWLDECF